MINTDSDGLHYALARLARRTRPQVLLAIECVGLLSLILTVVRDASLALALLSVTLVAFGLWGLADVARRASLRRGARHGYSTVQLAAALIGAGAVVAFMLAIGGVAIGTIIS